VTNAHLRGFAPAPTHSLQDQPVYKIKAKVALKANQGFLKTFQIALIWVDKSWPSKKTTFILIM